MSASHTPASSASSPVEAHPDGGVGGAAAGGGDGDFASPRQLLASGSLPLASEGAPSPPGLSPVPEPLPFPTGGDSEGTAVESSGRASSPSTIPRGMTATQLPPTSLVGQLVKVGGATFVLVNERLYPIAAGGSGDTPRPTRRPRGTFTEPIASTGVGTPEDHGSDVAIARALQEEPASPTGVTRDATARSAPTLVGPPGQAGRLGEWQSVPHGGHRPQTGRATDALHTLFRPTTAAGDPEGRPRATVHVYSQNPLPAVKPFTGEGLRGTGGRLVERRAAVSVVFEYLRRADAELRRMEAADRAGLPVRERQRAFMALFPKEGLLALQAYLPTTFAKAVDEMDVSAITDAIRVFAGATQPGSVVQHETIKEVRTALQPQGTLPKQLVALEAAADKVRRFDLALTRGEYGDEPGTGPASAAISGQTYAAAVILPAVLKHMGTGSSALTWAQLADALTAMYYLLEGTLHPPDWTDPATGLPIPSAYTRQIRPDIARSDWDKMVGATPAKAAGVKSTPKPTVSEVAATGPRALPPAAAVALEASRVAVEALLGSPLRNGTAWGDVQEKADRAHEAALAVISAAFTPKGTGRGRTEDKGKAGKRDQSRGRSKSRSRPKGDAEHPRAGPDVGCKSCFYARAPPAKFPHEGCPNEGACWNCLQWSKGKLRVAEKSEHDCLTGPWTPPAASQ